MDSYLWVNDAPDERLGNGSDPADWHGHRYAEGKHHVIAVSFRSEDGAAVRVSFDPTNGAVTCQDITEEPVPAMPPRDAP